MMMKGWIMQVKKFYKKKEEFIHPDDNGLCIYAKPGEDIEKMIKRFKKKLIKEDMFDEFQKRRFYIKPSKLKRIKKQEGILKHQRECQIDN
jgi:ribosomal protein S21